MASYGSRLKTRIYGDEEFLSPLENRSISNKSLTEQVESVTRELEHHFQLYHRMLDDKQKQIISQLDAVLLSANDLYKKRSELIQTQGELEEKVKSNRFHDMKVKMLEPLLTEMSELERSISRSEREVLELEWKDSQLGAAIEKSCVVLRNTSISYEDRQVPIWSVGSVGSADGQLKEARGLAIDADNEDIYIADCKNNRIAIFNKEGLFERNISSKDMSEPWTVLVPAGGNIFVSCNVPEHGLIIKVDKRTGKEIATLKPRWNVSALTLDQETGLLLCCPCNQASIWYIEQEGLTKVFSVKLQTPNTTQSTAYIYALEALKDEIFILFYSSTFPLQAFSRDGALLRKIISAEVVIRVGFFTIDPRGNLIISDNLANKVKVFSPTGKLMAVIGKVVSGEGKDGELYSPRGVAVTKSGRIVVCDGKTKKTLQKFLYVSCQTSDESNISSK